MPAQFGPVLVAAATAAIGYFFQQNSAKNAYARQQADALLEQERRLRERELQRAHEIFQEISGAMDVLYYYVKHSAMHVAVRRARDGTREKEDRETWDAYERALVTWMTNKTRFSAEIRQYFGDRSHQRLKAIQEAFGEAKSLLHATFYKRSGSVVKKGKEDSGRYYGEIVDPLEGKVLELTEQMIRDIQNQHVGRLRTLGSGGGGAS